MYRNKLARDRSALRMAVDLVSNTVAITAANPAYAPTRAGLPSTDSGAWGKAIADGTLSDNLIWPILHELTHHSSLQTPVGNSLCALGVSHTNQIDAIEADANQLNGPAKDMIRFAAANSFLKPIMEGLALFAEFDAVSGDVPIASWSSQVAARLFCLPEMSEALLAGKDSLSPLKRKLEALRLSDDMVSRKAQLLRRDLFDPDGYLLGYLLIKMMWVDLTMRQDIWRNTDMFLMFANDYFFNDFQLADLLVRPADMSVEDDLKNLETYLHNRLVALGRNCAEFGTQFAKYYTSQTPSRPAYHNYSESVDDFLKFEWTKRSLIGLHWQSPNFHSNRHIPRILAAPAIVSIDQNGSFEARFHDGLPTLRGPALEAGRPANRTSIEADGSVEAILLLPQHGRKSMRVLLCVFLDKDLIATFDPETGEFNDVDGATACDKMASYLSIETFNVMIEDAAGLPDGSKAAEILASYSGDKAIKRMLDLWSPWALIPDVGESERSDVVGKLENGGLATALSLTGASLEKAARMSLLPLDCSPDFDGPGAIPIDFAWLDNLNNASRETLGFRLLATIGDRLAPSRI